MSEHRDTLPRAGRFFLKLFLDPTDYDQALGDFEESFRWERERHGRRAARRLFWAQWSKSLPSFIADFIYWRFAMIHDTLKIGWRILRRRKLFSLVNIVGLAVSLACGLLILFHVREELSYEKNFPKSDRIYRLRTDSRYGSTFRHWGASAPALGPILPATFPEIEASARLMPAGSQILSVVPDQGPPRRFEQEAIVMADPAVVSLFDLEFLAGDPATALTEPRSIVLTESAAKRFFGSENPLGRKIMNETYKFPFLVTGVMADLPRTTHLQIGALVSLETFRDYYGDRNDLLNHRTWKSVFTYLLLRPGRNANVLEAKFPAFASTFFADLPGRNESFFLQPIRTIHLHSKLEGEFGANSDIAYVYVFTGAALLLLFIAGANFVNLSTAQALRRMKEIGVRKVIGARRPQIIKQYLGESLLVTGLAAAISLVLLRAALPLYNSVGGKSVRFAEVATAGNLAVFVALVLLFSLLAGLYPAWYVSAFRPANTLKSVRDPRSSAARLRKGLVVLQFAISIFMIFCTITMSRQLAFFHHRPLGFDKDNLIAVKLYGEAQEKAVTKTEVLKSEILRNPDIRQVALTTQLFGTSFSNERLTPVNVQDRNQLPMLRFLRVDEDFVRAAGLEIVAGRDFNAASDKGSAYIISESTRAVLGLDQPLGFQCRSDIFPGTAPIVGVIKDFHFVSLHNAIEPLVLHYRPDQAEYLLVKTDRARVPRVLDFLKTTMAAVAPDNLFQYRFVDEVFDRNYAGEKRSFGLFRVFSALALAVACLGLFGLTVFATETRIREIGIRKVMGATGGRITLLLSRPFLIWTGLANLIALPLAFWAMKTWLAGFAYRTTITVWTFVWAAGVAFLFTILTVVIRASQAAAASPADNLRYE